MYRVKYQGEKNYALKVCHSVSPNTIVIMIIVYGPHIHACSVYVHIQRCHAMHGPVDGG